MLAARTAVACISAVLAVAGWRLDLWFLPWPLAIFAIMGACGVMRAAIGGVRIDAGGIVVRNLFRVQHIAWTDILGIDVNEHVTGRSVSVHVGTTTVRLPIPRTARLIGELRFNDDVARLTRAWGEYAGKVVSVPLERRSRRSLLAAAMVATLALVSSPDRPWGWFGGPTASAIPDACTVLPPDIAARLGATDPRPVGISPDQSLYETYAAESECSWTLPAGGTMIVLYERYLRHGLHSATDEAQHNTAVARQDIGETGDMTRADASITTRHGIPGALFVGENALNGTPAYVATTSHANVIIGVAGAGNITLDTFASVVNVAVDAIKAH